MIRVRTDELCVRRWIRRKGEFMILWMTISARFARSAQIVIAALVVHAMIAVADDRSHLTTVTLEAMMNRLWLWTIDEAVVECIYLSIGEAVVVNAVVDEWFDPPSCTTKGR